MTEQSERRVLWLHWRYLGGLLAVFGGMLIPYWALNRIVGEPWGLVAGLLVGLALGRWFRQKIHSQDPWMNRERDGRSGPAAER